jgi:hypothetical protein
MSLAVAAAFAFVGLPTAHATLLRALDLTELVAAADQIVLADVLSVQAAWDGSHRTIHTIIEIGVRESWKGLPPTNGRITIRQLGGTVGEIEMTVHGTPKFSVGERALLFLHGSQVVGMSQGKRDLRWDAAGRRWRVAPADRSTAVSIGSQGQLRGAEPDRVEDLDTLRARIRGLVGR